jgi:hypothetical protein
MMARKEVEGEWDLFVGQEIPAGAMKGIGFDGCDADSLPAQPG